MPPSSENIKAAAVSSSRPVYKASYALPFVILIVLQVVGAIFFSNYTWGFSFWNIFSETISVILLAVALILCLPPAANRLSSVLSIAVNPLAHRFRKINRTVSVIATSLILMAVFYFFRSKSLVYGDGYTILGYITSEEIFIHRLEMMQILNIWFHRLAYLNLVPLSGLAADQVFALVNCVAGVACFWAVVRLIFILANDAVTRWFLTLGTLASATVILFFGYIEYYPWAWAFALWSLAFSVGSIKGRNSWWPAIVCGVIGIGFHIITLPFLLTALVFLLLPKGEDNRLIFGLKTRHINIFAVFAAPVFVLLVNNFGPDFVFVSLWPQPGDSYWLLSLQHVVDLINHMILVAPVGLALFIWGPRRFGRDSAEQLLLMAFLFNFLVAFWFDPLVGMPRDWDLLSGYGIPLSLWGCYRFARRFEHRSVPFGLIVAVAITAFIFIIPNLVEKNNPYLAVSRLDRLLFNDPHYAADQDKRIAAWTDILRHEVFRNDLAEKYYWRHLQGKGNPHRSWFNLGELCMNRQEYDSAAYCYRQAIGSFPSHAQSWSQLARAEDLLGHPDEALRCIEQAERLDPRSESIQTTYGVILMRVGKFDMARDYLHRAVDINPASATANMYLGINHYYRKQFDSARQYLMTAHTLDPHEARILEVLIQTLLEQDDIERAAIFIGEYEGLDADPSKLAYYRERLAARK